jgi:hypothetical protein
METTEIPENIVIKLVTSLRMNHLFVYSEFFSIKNEKILMTIFPFEKDSTNFIIIFSNNRQIKFFSVQYTTSLLSSSVLKTMLPIRTTSIRGHIKMSIQGNLYEIITKIPDIHVPEDVKQVILTLFNFPGETFLLNGSLIFHFTEINSFHYLTYIGNYNNESIDSIVYWDYGNETLIGKIKDQVYYIFNSMTFDYCNQYGSIRDNGYIILGGIYNYLVDTKSTNIKTITYSYPLSVQTSELEGKMVRFCGFKTFVPVKHTINYFIAIANTLENNFPNYAIFSKSSFYGTRSTIQTFPVVIEFVEEKDETFQKIDTMFFQYNDNVVKIYKVGYDLFLKENNSIEIGSVVTYEKDFSKQFNVQTNSLNSPSEIVKVNTVEQEQFEKDNVMITNEDEMINYFGVDYQK